MSSSSYGSWRLGDTIRGELSRGLRRGATAPGRPRGAAVPLQHCRAPAMARSSVPAAAKAPASGRIQADGFFFGGGGSSWLAGSGLGRRSSVVCWVCLSTGSGSCGACRGGSCGACSAGGGGGGGARRPMGPPLACAAGLLRCAPPGRLIVIFSPSFRDKSCMGSSSAVCLLASCSLSSDCLKSTRHDWKSNASLRSLKPKPMNACRAPFCIFSTQ
mmetsp:Transcript_87907/g.232667  ORF Transcript_87907/g.232667 Transcript_87907/m.232667 type:complete len:216 (+) Transcript_87907:216-863(+)